MAKRLFFKLPSSRLQVARLNPAVRKNKKRKNESLLIVVAHKSVNGGYIVGQLFILKLCSQLK